MSSLNTNLNKLERAASDLLEAIKSARESYAQVKTECAAERRYDDLVAEVRAQLHDLISDPSYERDRDKKLRRKLESDLQTYDQLAYDNHDEGGRAARRLHWAMIIVVARQQKIAKLRLPAVAVANAARWKPDSYWDVALGKEIQVSKKQFRGNYWSELGWKEEPGKNLSRSEGDVAA